MDDDTAYQLAEHTYAAVMWILRYIEDHDLSFKREDRIELLECHLGRIEALFTELEYPLSDNPIMLPRGRRPPDNAIECL